MKILIGIVLCGVTLLSSHSFAKDIHREKSLYRNILVTEKEGRRCLVFTVKRGDRSQTCINLQDPKQLVFPYVRMSLGGLLLDHEPKRILIVGLGGGSIPLTLNALFPTASIDVVEIDPAVVRVAQEYFGFKENEQLSVHVADARVFTKRAVLRKAHYDLIILDAFTGDYIPEHLMTKEYLEETKAILDKPGVLVANTFSTSKLYDYESVTYHEVFGDFFNFKMPITGNRVIIASTTRLPSEFLLRSRAKQLSARLANYGVDIESYPDFMARGADWDTSVRSLTDQYSPANLLQGEN